MNRALVLHTFRQRLFRPVPLVVALGTFVLPLVASIFEEDDLTPEMLPFFVGILSWALAAGVVGREMENGSLHLLLARPLTRSCYLFCRLSGTWLAFFSVVSASWIATIGAVALVGGSLEVATSSARLFSLLLRGTWWIVLISALSTVAPGYSDLGLLLLVIVFPMLPAGLGKLLELGWLEQAGFFVANQVFNEVRIFDWSFSDWDWRALLRYASNLTLVLAAAFWYFNRRELGYGRD
ncbi:MAG: ABC transporter permease subunit [Thermoanaerobaculum sp.]